VRGALLQALTLVAAGIAGAAPLAERAPRVSWIDGGGTEIPAGGALGVHGLADDGASADGSPSRFRLVLEAPPGPPSLRVAVAAVPSAGGRDRDALRDVPLEPFGEGRLATPWLVAVTALEDRRDPALAGRALRVRLDDRVEARVRRGGGRAGRFSRAVTLPERAPEPLARRRIALEATVLGREPGGPPVVGGDEAGAAAALGFQFAVLNEVLGPCAVWVGPPEEVPVRLAEPACSALIAVGDPLGLPSGGGEVRLEIDGRRLAPLRIGAGYEPVETARVLAARIREAGFAALVSPNGRNPFAAHATADVVVSREDGSPAEVRPWEDFPLSSDPRQPIAVAGCAAGARLAAYDANGIAAGTAAERALVKIHGPRDPGTLGVFVVGALADGRKLGEAFVRSATAALGGSVILDWRALRGARQSFVLSHEVVHVLLDDPGHPDAAGDPRPELLMHSRAGSALHGPRRLTAEQCRAIRRGLPPGLSSSSGT
jgi:hypothetical protein